MRKYGIDKAEAFTVDISNSKIYKALEKYKVKIGLPILCPLSKKEIAHFEKTLNGDDLIVQST